MSQFPINKLAETSCQRPDCLNWPWNIIYKDCRILSGWWQCPICKEKFTWAKNKGKFPQHLTFHVQSILMIDGINLKIQDLVQIDEEPNRHLSSVSAHAIRPAINPVMPTFNIPDLPPPISQESKVNPTNPTVPFLQTPPMFQLSWEMNQRLIEDNQILNRFKFHDIEIQLQTLSVLAQHPQLSEHEQDLCFESITRLSIYLAEKYSKRYIFHAQSMKYCQDLCQRRAMDKLNGKESHLITRE